jgi:hypothetical protein
MKRRLASLAELTDQQLLQNFIEISLAQDDSLLDEDVPRYNALFKQLSRVVNELRDRPGDSRRVVIQLYGHENLQVSLNAANETLALAPEQARRELARIKATKQQPQAMDAGMALRILDLGIFKPS